MSTAFTTLTNTTSWLDVALANEIIAALNERIEAADSINAPTPIAARVAGTDIAVDLAWIKNMQNAVVALIPLYLDHTEIPNAGDLEGETPADLPTYDATAFNTVVGHTLWRRATSWDPDAGDDWTDPSDAMYATPGIAQAGDIDGPWCFEDLQLAITALKWTYKSIVTGTHYAQEARVPDSEEQSTCAATVSAYAGNWAASGWENIMSGSVANFYKAQAILVDLDPSGYYVYVDRIKSRAQITDLFHDINCIPEVYFLINNGGFGPYLDFDSLGVGDGEYYYHESLGSDAAAVRKASWFGAYDTDPFSLSGLACPNYVESHTASSTALWVLKWFFTTSG